MSQKYSLTKALGAYSIIASLIPLIFSFLHSYPGLYYLHFYLEPPSRFYDGFLLLSFFIMIPLGWCLCDSEDDSEKWASEAAILFVVVSIIIGSSSLWFDGITGSSTWIIANFIFLGILLSDWSRAQLSKESSTSVSPEPSIAPE